MSRTATILTCLAICPLLGAADDLPYPLPAPATDEDFYDDGKPPAAKVNLGRNLFFDKILSGNTNISCATCHHPRFHAGDALSLSIGEGGVGLGTNRQFRVTRHSGASRVPRNAQPLFNLGARVFTVLFHDGRIEPDSLFKSGFRSPASNALPEGLDSPLAIQAMFPVVSRTEMAGHPLANEVAATFDRLRPPQALQMIEAWDRLVRRLQQIPEYVEQFKTAFDDIEETDDIEFVHAANAIAAFETVAFRADQSPFDMYLRGRRDALADDQLRGLRIFYGKGHCARCHYGVFQTDLQFHAIGIPPIGEGKQDGIRRLDDYGRQNVTFRLEDRYRFRTPSLRNVALTAPYGHSGAYATIEAVVAHHLDPKAALAGFDTNQVVLPRRSPRDFEITTNTVTHAHLVGALTIEPVTLRDDEFQDVIAFLHSLTDPASVDLTSHIPPSVPSGLPVEQ